MDYAMTTSGLIMPEYIIRKPKHLTAFDFFCGCGGFSLGFMQGGGWEIVGANEWDAAATMTYLANLGNYPMEIHYIEGEKDKDRLNKAIMREWGIKGADVDEESLAKAFGTDIKPNKLFCAESGWIDYEKRHGRDVQGIKNFWFGDVRKLKGKDILDALGMKQGDIDVVMGGPPCQGFSRSGKQNIADPRNNLVYEYARMIVELQPKTFVMEEVPDIVNFYDPDGVPVLDKFCMILEEGDYGKWNMIKKTLLMQAGSAGVIKDGLKRHKTKPQKKAAQKHDTECSLFGGEEVYD